MVEGLCPGSKEGSKEWMMISGLFLFCGKLKWFVYIDSFKVRGGGVAEWCRALEVES